MRSKVLSKSAMLLCEKTRSLWLLRINSSMKYLRFCLPVPQYGGHAPRRLKERCCISHSRCFKDVEVRFSKTGEVNAPFAFEVRTAYWNVPEAILANLSHH